MWFGGSIGVHTTTLFELHLCIGYWIALWLAFNLSFVMVVHGTYDHDLMSLLLLINCDSAPVFFTSSGSLASRLWWCSFWTSFPYSLVHIHVLMYYLVVFTTCTTPIQASCFPYFNSFPYRESTDDVSRDQIAYYGRHVSHSIHTCTQP